MPNSIDERVLQMKFDNAQFEQGIKTSMSSLETFDRQLKSKEGSKGLTELADSAEKVASKFSAMSIMATTAIVNITNSAVNAGKRLVSALTIEPITTGLNEYELKMGSVQTIMMGTGESLDTVMDKLEELNKYADRTIYSFQDMTSNIGKFTNAGVKLDVATKAIQGVSNLAALSGAGAVEASRAMYNISQSLGTGYMQLIDWKSIENANMATMEFKKELIATAKEMGVLNDVSNVTAENFRETLQDKWLTSDVLLKTLTKYTDESTVLGKKAFAAATQIKTATQLFDVMKESVQSGWAVTWENIIGNFDEAKELFTGIGQVFDFFVGKSADARNSVLKDWKDLGGRTDLIQGLYNIFANILMIIDPIKRAFHDIFPPITGQRLADMTKKFREFTNHVWLSREAADGLRNIIGFLLTPFKALGQVIKITNAVLKVGAVLTWALTQKFLELFSSADRLREALKNVFGDERYTRIMTAMNSIVKSLSEGINYLAKSAMELLNAFASMPVVQNFFASLTGGIGKIGTKGLDGIVNSIETIAKLLKRMPSPDFKWSTFLKEFGNGAQTVTGFIGNLITKVLDLVEASGGLWGILSKIGNAFTSIFKPMTVYAKGVEQALSPFEKFKAVLSNLLGSTGDLRARLKRFTQSLQTTIQNITPAKILIVGFGLSLILLIKHLSDLTKNLSKFAQGFEGVGNSIKFKYYIQGIRNLAIGIGVLSAAFLALAFATKKMDWKQLVKAGIIIGGMTAAVIGLTVAFSKLNVNGNVLKNAGLIAGMVIALSVSLTFLTKAFNELKYSLGDADVVEGKLIIMGTMLAGLGAFCIALSKWGGKIEVGAITILSMAVALKIMVSAFESFKKVPTVSFNNVLAISGIMISAAIAFMGLSKFSAKAAIGIAMFAGTLMLIPKVIETIENIKVNNVMMLINNFMMIMSGLATFMLMSMMAGENIAKAGVGILAAVSSLIVIGKAIKVLASIPEEEMLAGADVIKGMLKVFALITLASAFAGKHAVRAGVAIQLMSIALLGVIGAIALMTLLYDSFDVKVVDRAAICVGAMMLLFGLVTMMSSKAGGLKNMAAVITGIGLLLTATALLTLIPTDELKATTKSICSVLGMFALAMAASSKVNWKGALAIIPPLIALSIGFIAINKFLGDVDWKQMLASAIGMKIMANGIAKATESVSKIRITKRLAKQLLAFSAVALIMSGLAFTLGKLGREFFAINFAQLIAGSISLAILAGALAEATVLLSKAKFTNMKKMSSDLLAFVGVAATLSLVAGVLGTIGKDFMSLPIPQLIAGSVAIGIMANAFASATLILSKAKFTNFEKMKNALIGFAGIALSMAIGVSILAPAMQKLSDIPVANLISIAVAISIMSVAFAGATIILEFASKIGKSATDMILGAAAMVIMAGAMRILTPALVELSNTDFGSTMLGLLGMVAAIGVLGVSAEILSKVLPDMVLGTAVLAGFGLALRLIVPPLAQLAAIPFANLAAGIGGLTLAIVAMGVCAGILGVLFPVVALGTIVLAGFGIVLIEVAAAMNLGAQAVNTFATAMNLLVPSFTAMEQMDLVGLALGLSAVGIASGLLGIAGTTLIPASVGVIAFAAALGVLSLAIQTLDTVLTSTAIFQNLFNVGNQMGTQLVNGVNSTSGQMKSAAIDHITGFVNGIKSNLGSLMSAGVSAAQSFIQGFRSKKGIDSHSPGREGDREAKDHTDGFKNRLEKEYSTYRELGTNAAKEFIDPINDSVDDTKKAAENSALGVGQGILKGISESCPEISTGIANLGNFIESKLGGVLNSIQADIPIKELMERALSGESLMDLMGLSGLSDIGGNDESPFDFSGITEGLVGGSGGGVAGAANEVSDAFESMRDSIESSIDIFSKFDDTVDITASQLLVNLNSQLEGVQDWSTSLAQMAAKGFDEGLIKQLADQGTSSYKYVKAFLTMTQEEIFAYNTMFNMKAGVADNAIENIKKALPKLTKSVASETKKTIEEIGHTKDAADKATKGAVDDIKNVDNALEENAKTVRYGMDIDKKALVVMQNTTGALDDVSNGLVEVSDNVVDTTAVITEITDATVDLTDATTDLNDGFITLVDENGEVIGALEGTIDGLDATAESMGNVIEFTDEMVVEFVVGMAKMKVEMEELRTNIKDSVESSISIFEEFDGKTELTADKLISNMESQVNGINTWANNLETLAGRGVDDGLLKHLAELGPKGFEYVNAFVQMSDSQLSRAASLYQTSLQLPETVSNRIVASFENAGMWSAEGLIQGILERHGEINTAGAEAAAQLLDGTMTGLDAHSPSRKMNEIGKWSDEGLRDGIKNNERLPIQAGKNAALAIVNAVKDTMGYWKFYALGQDAGKGMANGIESMASTVASAASNMARKAFSAAQAAIDSHSPSRLFEELGMYSDIGFANGFDKYAYVVEDAASGIGDRSLSAMRKAIDDLYDYAISDDDIQPVICPVLDLSQIQNGVHSMNSMLDVSKSVDLATNASRSMVSQGSTVTYNNTIDNSEVVNAIGQLRTDLSELSARVGNMKVFMDSGALVGEIVEPIDNALGARMALNGRGI